MVRIIRHINSFLMEWPYWLGFLLIFIELIMVLTKRVGKSVKRSVKK